METLAIASAVFSTVGAVQRGRAESGASNYNAKIAEQNAAIVRQQSLENMRQRRIEGRKEAGAARAAYGASGVTLSGSPIEAIQDSIFTTEMDAFNIEYEGRLQDISYQNEAKLMRYQAKNQRTQGYLNAAGGLLGARNASGGSLWGGSRSSTSLNYPKKV
jgi:hypothetical protein